MSCGTGPGEAFAGPYHPPALSAPQENDPATEQESAIGWSSHRTMVQMLSCRDPVVHGFLTNQNLEQLSRT